MSQDTSQNNKRIAKNTIFLYIRMLIMLVVGLFTSRIVLDALGATDYGIYNIIGGVVVLFSFLNQALTTATQRFLNFNLGKGDAEGVKTVFCMSMNSYIILSIIFLLLAESIGLWFVNSQLNIPINRMAAMNWVYQFSIITFIINLIRIPYNASIMAYERMDFFAYISLGEVILKLLVIYALFINGVDRLILYSFLYTVIPLLMNYAYKIYCNKQFDTIRFRLMWNKSVFHALFSFSGWSLFGSIANMMAQQGLNILINIFFGVTVNAAVGIANQVSTHVMQFVSNFQMAFQPQIVKTYAAQQIDSFHKLIFQTSKFSFYLIYIIALPFILTTQIILNVWLVDVPQYTAIFCQLLIGFFIIEAVSAPMWMSVQAIGNIKNYQILMSICIVLNFPFTYLAFKCGLPVYTAWIIRISINLLTFVVRSWYINTKFNFPIREYVKQVLKPIFITTLISLPLPLFLAVYMEQTVFFVCIIVAVSFVVASLSVYTVGMTANEKKMVVRFVTLKIFNKK